MDRQIEIIKSHLSDHELALKSVRKNRKTLCDVANESFKALDNRKKIVFFGNGGSAAQAQHFAAELVVSYDERSRQARLELSAIALTTDTSVLTATANDFGFDKIFERQVGALVNEGDVVVGISTSWKSENVIKGIQEAKFQDAITVAFGGRFDSRHPINNHVDYWLGVDSDKVGSIQEVHLVYGHLLCKLIDERYMGGNGKW